jgi:hypothetical protein
MPAKSPAALLRRRERRRERFRERYAEEDGFRENYRARHRRNDARYREQHRDARRAAAKEWYAQQRREHFKVPRRIGPEPKSHRSLGPFPEIYPYHFEHPLVRQANEMIPRSLPEDIRADACQEFILSMLEGRKPQLPEIIKKAWAMRPDRFGSVSLYAEDRYGRTLEERLAQYR